MIRKVTSQKDDYEAKNEIRKLKDMLDGNDPDERAKACKRVIALMRSGDNVQSLFSSMLRCVRTSDLELKKLVYLYLVTYARHEPEQAIMAVNAFILDSRDGNPLVRALAVRNMCRVRLESVAEHMVVPLKRALADADAYVRKTAVFAVAKLYEIIPESVEDAELIGDLIGLLRDENPMVVSNAVTALFEINERRETPVFTVNQSTVGSFLNALSSCTLWCQVMVLDALGKYVPETSEDASWLIDRLVAVLKNTNPAVVMSAFRCIFLYMDVAGRKEQELFAQIIPPFITLLSSSDPEVQYFVLRTSSLFVQKYPKALMREVRVFFCKYNEPSYIKMEKLDIIVTICTASNAQLILHELHEYCNAVDVGFVQKTIRAVGQIAMKIAPAATGAVGILVSLIKGKADYAVDEAVVVMCDIFRKYPGEFESVLISICPHLERIKEPRAKTAGLWILGEYCHVIEGVDVLIDPFLETFPDEQVHVQLQILASLVKIFLHDPDATRDQMQFILSAATKDGNVPDVKNRALIYWRLLSAGPEAAAQIVRFDKQSVTHSGVTFDESVLMELIRNMGRVSGVLHVVPSDFVQRTRFVPDTSDTTSDSKAVRVWTPARMNSMDTIDVLVDFDRSNMYLKIVNRSLMDISGLAFAVNKNVIGLTIGDGDFPDVIQLGDMVEVKIPITVSASAIGNTDAAGLQMAFRVGGSSIFGLARIPIEVATTETGNISQGEYSSMFMSLPETATTKVEDRSIASDSVMRDRHVYVVGRNDDKAYASLAVSDSRVLVELAPEDRGFRVSARCSSRALLPIVMQNALYLFADK